jgi:hypothetical protein
MTDATLPYGSDPAWQAGIAQLRALGSPLDTFSNIGNLGMAAIRALATVPYAMASALSGGQDARREPWPGRPRPISGVRLRA